MLYFAKRLLLFVPTLLVLSMFFFYLSKLAKGDPVLNQVEAQIGNDINLQLETKLYKELKKKYALDLPSFYFSIHRKSSTDTLNKIPNPQIRENLVHWAYQLGSWEKVNQIYQDSKKVLASVDLTSAEKQDLYKILKSGSLVDLTSSFHEILDLNFENRNTIHWNNYSLKYNWYGVKNQYHQWIGNVLTGNLGSSYLDGSSVNTKIGQALIWTLTISFFALFIALIIAIPTAVYSAYSPTAFWSKTINLLFLGLYSIPNFWLATLLIIFLAGGDYLSIFPAYGPGLISENDGFFKILHIRFSHLFLPVFCVSYGSLAYLYKQIRNSIEKELNQAYIQAAFARGLSVHQVLWKHAFKNASLPLITLLGKSLPALFSGSFIIEYIFSIQGMGKLTIESFLARDYPVIFGILLLVSLLTLLGSWLADIFYQRADPKIQIGTTSSLKNTSN